MLGSGVSVPVSAVASTRRMISGPDGGWWGGLAIKGEVRDAAASSSGPRQSARPAGLQRHHPDVSGIVTSLNY